jgi:hypothetical protein
MQKGQVPQKNQALIRTKQTLLYTSMHDQMWEFMYEI